MPTYEYQCAKCGDVFEKFQSMKDAALSTCPKDLCAQKRWGKGKVKRTIGGGAGLIFKGSGFYITDYRSENYKAGAKKDAPATSKDSATTTSASSATATSSGGDKSKSGGEKTSAKSNGASSKPAST